MTNTQGNWSGSYYGSYTNPEIAIQLVTVSGAANDFELTARLTDAGGQSPIRDTNKTGYVVGFDGLAGYTYYKVVNGTFTELQSYKAWTSGSLSNGDSVGFRIAGSTLQVWCKRGAAA
jgi:hypothetical protein